MLRRGTKMALQIPRKGETTWQLRKFVGIVPPLPA